MTKCYNIWIDLENNKRIKEALNNIKFALDSHLTILKLKEHDYTVDVQESKDKILNLSDTLQTFFPKEGDITDEVWLEYKQYYFEDGTLVEEDITDEELNLKKLNILKRKITFLKSILPKVKLVTGKDEEGEKIEEEVIVEAYTDISIKGQQIILDTYYQFKKLLDTI